MPTHSALRGGKRQGGFAMLAIVSLIVLMSAYLLVKQLNASAGRAADNRNHNAKVLNQAKQALIGYVAQQTALAGEDNPGRLPCPEAPGNYATPNEGIAAGNCTLPAVGRLPWRTLGLDKLVDAASEPLWYVVSTGWALPTSTATLTINSNTTGQLAVDGVANDAVALIIAPGAAFEVKANLAPPPVCAARSQTHPTAAGTLDLRNYLECENATWPLPDANFVTTGPSTSFNDHVLRVTTADLVPGIEAAIAVRIEREIVPALKSVYYPDPVNPGLKWGSGISAANPLFPFAAPFANPGPGAGTSDFRGVAGTFQGLLPFNQTEGCAVSAANPRCLLSPLLLDWSSGTPPDVTKIGGFGYFDTTPACSWQSGGNVAFCEGVYHEDDDFPSNPGMVISMTATINNVAMGLRILDATKATIEAEDNDTPLGTTTIPTSVTATMQSNGSVIITFSGTLPNIDAKGWNTRAIYRIRLERSVIGDHWLLSPNAREITFGTGVSQITIGQTVTGATSGASARVAWVTTQTGTWGTNAAGTLILYSVTGAFLSGELLQVGGVTRATSASLDTVARTNWFVRNEWYRLLYYAVAQGHSAVKLPPVCPTTVPFTSSCLSVANVTPTNAQRAILILGGRSVNGTARPSATLADYLESGNATGAFTRKTVSASATIPMAQRFNDRVVVLDANP